MITIKEVKSKTIKRFWSKIKFGKPNQCWEWHAGLSNGYGILGIGSRTDKSKRTISAHKFMYLNVIGDTNNLDVCHTCDNKKCCNPNHFWLGTQVDNMKDMWKKGRGKIPHLKGEDHNKAKLTEKNVLEIRKSTLPKRILAIKFNVSLSTIYYAFQKKSWTHI